MGVQVKANQRRFRGLVVVVRPLKREHVTPMETPHIEYPGPWDYQLIGANEERIRGAVAVTLEDKYVLTFSHHSKNMRFCSMQLTIEVRDDAHRLGVFDKLRQHDDILFVL